MKILKTVKYSLMLIDTHILLWFLDGSVGAMGAETEAFIRSNFDGCVVSQVSFMEIKVKQRKGGLQQFSIDKIASELEDKGISILEISTAHISAIPGQDLTPHADPFDLLLIGQALSENMSLLTCDQAILEVIHPGLRLTDGRA